MAKQGQLRLRQRTKRESAQPSAFLYNFYAFPCKLLGCWSVCVCVCLYVYTVASHQWKWGVGLYLVEMTGGDLEGTIDVYLILDICNKGIYIYR